MSGCSVCGVKSGRGGGKGEGGGRGGGEGGRGGENVLLRVVVLHGTPVGFIRMCMQAHSRTHT